MSSAHQSLSSFSSEIPDAGPYRFGIVVSEWNKAITTSLFEAAVETLIRAGAKKENIIKLDVPGSFELVAGASHLIETESPDAIICLGCVIQGETRHFEFICSAVAQGLIQLTVKHSRPFIFGVLTTDNFQQATDRSGGKFGNKGDEAAVTAIKMAELFSKKNQD